MMNILVLNLFFAGGAYAGRSYEEDDYGKVDEEASDGSGSGADAASRDSGRCSGTEEAGKELTEVTLNEVAHSIFYAPMYVAVEEGYFEEEGIALDLVCGFGADKTMTAVISGEADIGFMGRKPPSILTMRVLQIM